MVSGSSPQSLLKEDSACFKQGEVTADESNSTLIGHLFHLLSGFLTPHQANSADFGNLGSPYRLDVIQSGEKYRSGLDEGEDITHKVAAAATGYIQVQIDPVGVDPRIQVFNDLLQGQW